MNCSIARYACFGAVPLLAAALLTPPALADGTPSGGKSGASKLEVTANVGLTSDYVFRGISQSVETTAVQGGVEITYGSFYAGVAGSSISERFNPGPTEVDLYAGYKVNTGRFAWDLGIIYYTYPRDSYWTDYSTDFYELKAAVSTELQKGLAVGANLFYAPDYRGHWGTVWTYEGTVSYVLPRIGIFNTTASALIGHSEFTDYETWWCIDNPSYTYWNAGVTLATGKWALDFRYWGSEDTSFAYDTHLQGDRFVASAKYSF